MTTSKLFLVLLGFLGFAAVTFASHPIQARMSYGAEVDTLKRFPHHVSIESMPIYYDYGQETQLCGGSIIHKNWILTSARCLDSHSLDSDRLNLNIQRLYKNDTSGSFTIVVNNNPDNVIVYPTEFDDIALVKVPVDLIFSDTIKPIEISSTPLNQLHKKLAVLPGFDTSDFFPSTGYFTTTSTAIPQYRPRTDSLTYAMLSIQPNNVCMNSFGSEVFDEFLNICTRGWGNNRNVPCLTDAGSGLVVDWPAKPKLIGMYSPSGYDCNGYGPSRFLNIQKYTAWIESVIN